MGWRYHEQQEKKRLRAAWMERDIEINQLGIRSVTRRQKALCRDLQKLPKPADPYIAIIMKHLCPNAMKKPNE